MQPSCNGPIHYLCVHCQPPPLCRISTPPLFPFFFFGLRLITCNENETKKRECVFSPDLNPLILVQPLTLLSSIVFFLFLFCRHPLFVIVVAGVGVIRKLQKLLADKRALREAGLDQLWRAYPYVPAALTAHSITCATARAPAFHLASALLQPREVLVPPNLFLPHLPVPLSWDPHGIASPLPAAIIVYKNGIEHLPHALHTLHSAGFEVSAFSTIFMLTLSLEQPLKPVKVVLVALPRAIQSSTRTHVLCECRLLVFFLPSSR